MPSLIVFGSLRGGPETAGDRVKVKDAASDAVEKLASTENGFAQFEVEGPARGEVWVNRNLVRAVRTAGE